MGLRIPNGINLRSLIACFKRLLGSEKPFPTSGQSDATGRSGHVREQDNLTAPHDSLRGVEARIQRSSSDRTAGPTVG
jgi:hypothetical protein